MVDIRCALHKKNNDVGLRLKENIKFASVLIKELISLQAFSQQWMFPGPGVLQEVGGPA